MQTTKSIIVASPQPINPNTGTAIIRCFTGNGYYVGDNCACVNISCTDGTKQRWCICKDGAIFQAFAKVINTNNNTPIEINFPFNIEYSVTEDLNTNLTPVEKVVNIKKIHNAIITISTTYKFDFTDYILILEPGEYEVKNNKLQTLSVVSK